jgi:hypothetical protein
MTTKITKEEKRCNDIRLYPPTDLRMKYGKLVHDYNSKRSDKTRLRFLLDHSDKFIVVLHPGKTSVIVKLTYKENEIYKSIVANGGDVSTLHCFPLSKPLPADDGTIEVFRLMDVAVVLDDAVQRFREQRKS